MASFHSLAWLDQEDQDALKATIKSYQAYPLERHDTLEWKGPSLFPRSTAKLTSTNGDRRSVISSLLAPDGPSSSSSTGWSLELVEPLKVGKFSDRNNHQVWRCRVNSPVGDRSEDHVVLKLYYDGYFFHRDGKLSPPSEGGWTHADGLVKSEALAYKRLKSLQGLDIPLCYGFFEFAVPSGHTVVGCILEDLTGRIKPLMEHVKQLHGRHHASPVEYTNRLNPAYLQCYRTLDKCHQKRIVFTGFLNETSFFLSKIPSKGPSNSSEDTVEIIIMGFSHARRAEDSYEWKEEGGEGSDWIGGDRSLVTMILRGEFGLDFDQTQIWYDRSLEGRMLEDLTDFWTSGPVG